MFFEEKGNFKRSIGNVEYYKILLDFYLEKIGGEDEGLFKEVLKFDYLCFNKKRWLPDFLVRTITKEDEQNIKDSFDRQMPFKKAHIEKFEIDMEDEDTDNIMDIVKSNLEKYKDINAVEFLKKFQKEKKYKVVL